MDWKKVDSILKVASVFILTDEEREHINTIEQNAYETNIPRIREILDTHVTQLKQRQFWTNLQLDDKGLKFLFSYRGFYGRGGFTSQQHIAGPLVLGTIEPKTGNTNGFYLNDLKENTFLGKDFDELAFKTFINNNLMDYLSPENQILSNEDYNFLRELLGKELKE